MKRFAFLIACSIVFTFVSSHAQVITSIGEQNLKIPKTDKIENKPQKPANDNLPQIDTTSVYFALLDSAQLYISKKSWSKAERFIHQAIVSEPSNANNSLLLSNLATIQRKQGRLNEALKNYNMALDMTPNAVTLLMNRASLLVQLDSLTAASNDYHRVIQLDPLQEEARYNHGMIALEQHDINTAKADFEDLLRHNPNSLLANEGLAMLNKASGNYDKAIQYYSKVIKTAPTLSLFCNRAECYMMTRHLNEAMTDINNALSIDPSDGYIYLLRARLNKLRYENNAAKRDLQLAIEHGIDPSIAKDFVQLEK